MDPADARTQIWLSRVHYELSRLSTTLLPSDELHTARNVVMETFSIFLTKAYPNSIIFPFVSFATKTYLPDEDLRFELHLPREAVHDHIASELEDLLNESALPLHGRAEANQERCSVSCCPGAINVEIFISSDQSVSRNAVNGELGTLFDTLGSEYPGLIPIFMTIQRAAVTRFGPNQTRFPSLVLFCLIAIYFQTKASEETRHSDTNHGLHILRLSTFLTSELDYGKRISITEGGRLLDKGPPRLGFRTPVSIEHPRNSSKNIAASIRDVKEIQEFFGGLETALQGALEDSDLIPGLGTSEYWPAQLSTTIINYSGLNYNPAPRDLLESIPRLQMLQNYWIAPRRVESNEGLHLPSTSGASTSQAAIFDDDDEAGYYDYVSDHQSDDVHDEFDNDDDDDDNGVNNNDDNFSSTSLSLSIADDFADSLLAINEGSAEDTIVVIGSEGEESGDDDELIEVHKMCFPIGWRRW